MKMSCQIIEDLLPLYADDACSPESRQAVEAHLRECEACRGLLESTKAAPLPCIALDRPAADKAVKKGFRKIRLRWWATVLAFLTVIPFAFLGWNEYSGQGAAYTNQAELALGSGFMDCLTEHRYDFAYNYLDIAELKQEWLEEWFDEETLANMENDAMDKFCELGVRLDEAGGIESYEYIGISVHAVEADGTQIYQIVYRIRFAGRETLAHLDVSEDGVEGFYSGGSFLDDPLAQFSMWAEYLWQDYEGCYFDPELKEYVYYDTE